MIVTDPEALRLKHNYVCNICWGDIVIEQSRTELDKDGHLGTEVRCSNPDCSGTGFVSKNYAERRKTESHFELIEARNNLSEVLGLEKREPKSVEQNLKEMGF